MRQTKSLIPNTDAIGVAPVVVPVVADVLAHSTVLEGAKADVVEHVLIPAKTLAKVTVLVAAQVAAQA